MKCSVLLVLCTVRLLISKVQNIGLVSADSVIFSKYGNKPSTASDEAFCIIDTTITSSKYPQIRHLGRTQEYRGLDRTFRGYYQTHYLQHPT